MKTKIQYLQILEITSENPEEKEIKSQYRKLCKIYHTDNPKTGNHEKFLEIDEAKEALLSGKYIEDNQKSFQSGDFLNFANGKISDFLNVVGETIKVPKIKQKRKLIQKKINDKIIFVFDVSALTQSKSILINNKVYNFILE